MAEPLLKIPYPYFGNKRTQADYVWSRLGDVGAYIEPFFGSGSVLLARPSGFVGREIANDLDGCVCNFWRAMRGDFEALVGLCDRLFFESDMHAGLAQLHMRREDLQFRLLGNPDFYDVELAAYWAVIQCGLVGTTHAGPWVVEDGVMTKGRAGGGIARNKRRPGNCGLLRPTDLRVWFAALSERCRNLIFYSGDWSRCVTPVFFKTKSTGVFLDPPYDEPGRTTVYQHDDKSVFGSVVDWGVIRGKDKDKRIVICGDRDSYKGEELLLAGWSEYRWSRERGMAKNKRIETMWFSPHCLPGGLTND